MSKSFNTLLAGVIASTALLAAVPAMAASVVGATRISISSAIPTWLQIAEVEAIEFVTLTNVSAASNGGSATATSSGFGSSPGGAIDGLIPGGFIASQVWHSGSPSGSESLSLLLSHASTLDSLRIYGVMDEFRGRNLFNYTIYNAADDVLASGVLDSRDAAPAVVTFDAPPSTGAVPEPATWAMIILGFGAVGSAMRSRRRALA